MKKNEKRLYSMSAIMQLYKQLSLYLEKNKTKNKYFIQFCGILKYNKRNLILFRIWPWPCESIKTTLNHMFSIKE